METCENCENYNKSFIWDVKDNSSLEEKFRIGGIL